METAQTWKDRALREGTPAGGVNWTDASGHPVWSATYELPSGVKVQLHENQRGHERRVDVYHPDGRIEYLRLPAN